METPNNFIRKITVTGRGTYSVTLPKEMVQSLKWRKGQKIVFALENGKIIIKDWKPKD